MLTWLFRRAAPPLRRSVSTRSHFGDALAEVWAESMVFVWSVSLIDIVPIEDSEPVSSESLDGDDGATAVKTAAGLIASTARTGTR